MSKSKKYYQNIVKLIDNNDIEQATKIISQNNFSYRSYFNNRILEKQLDPSIKKTYLDSARYLLKLQEYELAYDYLEAGRYLSSNNALFSYYLGKLFFKMDYYDSALKYLLDYKQRGSLKLNKCYLYLFAKSKDYKTVSKYKTKLNELNNFLDIEFTLKNSNNYNKTANEKAIEKISEFSEEVKLDKQKLYSEYSLQEKLEYIKELLINKREKVANKLLTSLKATNQEEKELIKQLNNNKKLYLNRLK